MYCKIGIIGGSGLYNMGIIEDIEEIEINTPYGTPSDKISIGKINGTKIIFLPRHGKEHQYSPHKVNYRANIFSLKQCGVEFLVSTAAVGSLKKEIKPCDFVIANQLIDRTAKRNTSFFEEGIVAHVGFADPFCKKLSKIAYESVEERGLKPHIGKYICIEGPQFSTRAESNLFRQWDGDVIGMTLATEAKLAREAEMCLCGILTVTDYDCWYKGKKDVSVSSVVTNLKKNDKNIVEIMKNLIPKIKYNRDCECKKALDNAIITSHKSIERNCNLELKKVLLKRFLG
jgi:5'-methylthioadenosine phosphorylase